MENKQKIEKLQKLVDNPKTTDEERKRYKAFISKLEKDSKPEPKTDPKPKASKKEDEKKEFKKTAPKKKTPTKSKKKGTRKLSSNKVEIDGKEYIEGSKEYCDVLAAKFQERRANAKKAAKKRKTTSVMESVTRNIDKGITKAIKAGLRDRKEEIDKNPNKFFKKAEKLEKSTKTFLEDLKDVLGDEFEQKEVKDTVKSISDTIDELKKKFKDNKSK